MTYIYLYKWTYFGEIHYICKLIDMLLELIDNYFIRVKYMIVKYELCNYCCEQYFHMYNFTRLCSMYNSDKIKSRRKVIFSREIVD